MQADGLAEKAAGLLKVPDQFVLTAKAFPEKVDQALALLDDADGVAELLSKADALEHYYKRMKLDKELVTPIQYGRMKIVAKLGTILERTKGGRGKKTVTSARNGLFRPETVVTYRKVADHASKIDDYYAAVTADDEAEMSLSGFIRYVASDGNIKAHQNKGVIEWYTPEPYIEAARRAMGSIDLDPASSEIAQKIVKAKRFYTREQDGLNLPWKGSVFLNPPFKADLAKAFITRLCESHKSGAVPQAVLLTNNNTDTLWWHEAARCSGLICFTAGRINFYSPAGEIAQPTNGHTLFYFGGDGAKFKKEFQQFGLILRV